MQFRIKLTSKRDVDHILWVTAKDRDEAYKVGFGIDSGYGFPDDVEILETKGADREETK